MTADPQYLAAVEARANAATEGPWAVMRDAEGRPWVGKADGPFVGDDPAQDDADATFQAHARSDIPALVALVREAEARHTDAEGRVDFAVEVGHRAIAERDAARAALAALVAELRALLADEWTEEPPSVNYPEGRRLYRWPAQIRDDLRALADRYDGGEGR